MQWLRKLLSKRTLDEELDKEVRFHIEELTRGNIAEGLPPEQARRQALIAFGGPAQISEECRRMRSLQWLESVAQDLRFGLRTLLKDRAYTSLAILALALGLGANTALFTLFNGLVLRPLPVPEPASLVELSRFTSQSPVRGPFPYPEYVHYRDHSATLAGVSATSAAHLRMSGTPPAAGEQSGPGGFAGISGPQRIQGGAEPVIALFVSGNYFSVMGVNVIAGRNILPEDDQSPAPPFAALLSENFWERRFGRDPKILGQDLMFSGIPAQIVGITPRGFMGTRAEVPDVWLPLAAQMDPRLRLQAEGVLCCEVQARLKRGQTLDLARAEMPVLASSFHLLHPGSDQHSAATVEQAASSGANRNRVYHLLYYMFLQPAIGLVLLIACANVAGLLLGRAASRRKEIAVRLALGAKRSRLVRQLLTEGILIAQLAGGLSLLAAWLSLRIAVQTASSSLNSSGLSDGGTLFVKVTPDARVLLYTLGLAALTGIAFALAPALQSTKPDLTAALKDEGSSVGRGGKFRFRGWTVAIQIAVCLALLIGAGVMVIGSRRLLAIDPGFQTSNVLTVSILNPRELGYSSARTQELRNLLEQRLREMPGVKSLAPASRVPLGGNVRTTTVAPQGQQIAGDSQASVGPPQYPYSLVGAEYFETLGIPILHGRSFTPKEVTDRAPVAIVSESLARRLWPEEDALGKHITIGSPAQSRFLGEQRVFSESSEVIGVVREIRSATPVELDPGAVYLPAQSAQWDDVLLIRSESDRRALAASLGGLVQAVDHNLSVSYQALDEMLTSEPYFVTTRLGGIVFTVIGFLGLVMAAVGIYSMVGYVVSQQTREVGIRMALGAQKLDVLRLILGRSLWPIAAGIAAGMVLGTVASRLLAHFLQGVQLLDVSVVLTVSVLLAAVALLAACIPARKAMQLDPASTLRFE